MPHRWHIHLYSAYMLRSWAHNSTNSALKNVRYKSISLNSDLIQTTDLVEAWVHGQYDGTSLPGVCLDSHHPPSSRSGLTSRQSVSATDLVGRRQWWQHVPARDCVCQQPQASCPLQSHAAYAAHTTNSSVILKTIWTTFTGLNV